MLPARRWTGAGNKSLVLHEGNRGSLMTTDYVSYRRTQPLMVWGD